MLRIWTDSKSEPDLTTAGTRNRNSGYPPGFTVDELRFYRRRKAPESQAKDHLMPENGEFRGLKTEYKRRFLDYYNADVQDALHFDVKDLSPTHKHKPDDHLNFADAGDRDLHELLPESHESFIAFPIESPANPHRRFKRHYPMMDVTALPDTKTKCEAQSENRSQFVRYEPSTRTLPIRRSTSLNLAVDLALDPQPRRSENADQFIEYLLTRRRSIIRNPTHLRLDGEMEKKTENREQFKAFTLQPRLPLYRKLTQLRLEGDIDATTEHHERFVEHQLEMRPPLIKRNTNLQLVGDLILDPEYRHEFVEFERTGRSLPSLPRHNLKVDGFFDGASESRSIFTGHHPPIPFLRGAPEAHTDLISEQQPMEPCPEYKRSFVDFPRQRPRVVRPEAHLSNEGKIDHMTEKRAQYVEYPRYQKIDDLRREPELKLEGDFVCQPEYRKAYIDYLMRERIDRKTRPLDNLGSNAEPRKRVFEGLPTELQTLPLLALPAPKSSEGLAKTTAEPSSGTATTGVSKAAGRSLIPVATKTVIAQSSLPRRQVSISKLETQLFGPKIEMPARMRSSSSSRLTSRTQSPEGRSSRTGSRFSRSVHVEDLAYTPSTSPIHTHKIYSYSPRKKWSKERDHSPKGDRMTAFMVLDDLDDVNNNLDGFTNRNPVKSLYKEQKWMNSWNTSDDSI